MVGLVEKSVGVGVLGEAIVRRSRRTVEIFLKW